MLRRARPAGHRRLSVRGAAADVPGVDSLLIQCEPVCGTTGGGAHPAYLFAATPVSTMMPAPMMHPMPSSTRSTAPSTLRAIGPRAWGPGVRRPLGALLASSLPARARQAHLCISAPLALRSCISSIVRMTNALRLNLATSPSSRPPPPPPLPPAPPPLVRALKSHGVLPFVVLIVLLRPLGAPACFTSSLRRFPTSGTRGAGRARAGELVRACSSVNVLFTLTLRCRVPRASLSKGAAASLDLQHGLERAAAARRGGAGRGGGAG